MHNIIQSNPIRLIYINDICCSSSVLKFILFADDTNLFYSSECINDLQHVLNHEMAAFAEWFKANKLSLNVDKTLYILFCESNARRVSQPSFGLFIDSFKVKRVESCKFLGVYLDEKNDMEDSYRANNIQNIKNNWYNF